MLSFLKKIITQIRNDPKSWAVETTTMLGIALIAGAAWLIITGKIGIDQASGLIVIGVGLLYPQNATKQQQTQKAVIMGFEIFQALTHHNATGAPSTASPEHEEPKNEHQ